MIERDEIMAQAADEETSLTRCERGGAPASVDRRPATSTARGGQRKLAKRRRREQSLFEHTLIEIDVRLQVLPILAEKRHHELSHAEQRTLLVAVFAHGAATETDAFS